MCFLRDIEMAKVKSAVTLSDRTESKRFELTIPCRRKFAQLFETDATWQSTFNGRLGECGREEGQRQCHVDVAHAASLAHRDRLGICRRIRNEFIKPAPAAGNRCDQRSASLQLHRAERNFCGGWAQD